jgi:hypothetical protein
MAGGLVAFGDDRVSATSELGVPVLSVAIEARYDDPLGRRSRFGDRLHVATGSEVRSYDLATRSLVAVTPVAGASAVAVDRAAHRLVIGTAEGAIAFALLPALDEARAAGVDGLALGTQELARLDGPVTRLHVTEDGSALVAQVGQRLVMLDAEGGPTGEVALAGVAQLADAGRSAALVADTAEVTDPDAAADTLAGLVGGAPERYAALLASRLRDRPRRRAGRPAGGDR